MQLKNDDLFWTNLKEHKTKPILIKINFKSENNFDVVDSSNNEYSGKYQARF